MNSKKLNKNGKLPTAKDYENLKIKLSEADKKRIASTRAVLETIIPPKQTDNWCSTLDFLSHKKTRL
jgi:hypothetical protein